MTTITVTRRALLSGAGAIALSAGTARAQAKNYGPGVSDSEIKLGTTSPYSGPASAYGIYGHAQTAYFQMINEQGGINGRKITLISLDNAYNPPKALDRRESSSKRTTCWRSPASSARRPTPRCRSISTARRCRTCS